MPRPLNWFQMEMPLADLGTASAVRFLCTENGYLRRIESTAGGAVNADAVLTVSLNNTNLSPTITVATAGAAEGDYDFAEYFTPVKKGDWIEVTTDGGPSNAITATINAVFSP